MSSAQEGRVILWDTSSLTQLHEWQLPGPVNGVAFAADGRHLATANGNGTVYSLRIGEAPPGPLTPEEAKAKQDAAGKSLGVPVTIENSVGMKLDLIPAGKFLMGSPSESDRKENEGPQHPVTISKPFFVGIHEVTQEQYRNFLGGTPARFSKDNGGGPEHPVEMVSWDEAVAFCLTLSERPVEQKAGRTYRLPTEAEWEYACRAGSTTAYSFGEDGRRLEEFAWFNENTGKTQLVGRLAPNPWGLYDMHGGVWEWCADVFDTASYRVSPPTDPQGPTGPGQRVVRGGSWASERWAARAAYRQVAAADSRQHHCGFRVVCEIQPAAKKGPDK